MIVGTAGHIDHGKTTLVQALTGVDTDRLPEEKARGISIELGYAFLDVPASDPAERIGFIDVPGHERLVHTMLAGATGIDFGLLLVAADDGVMPQTREHLAVLSLLGIDRGAVAVTKTDRVDAARVAQVGAEVDALLAGTPLGAAPVLTVCAPTGDGVADLRALLFDAARATPHRDDAGAAFRIAIDRAFTLAGVGTVVTGTVHAGRVEVGDELALVPAGADAIARVRSLHAQNRPVEQARAGERCAIALAGIARDRIARGQWLVAPAIAFATDRLDAALTLWHGEAKALRSGTPVHVHVGASDVTGSVAVLQVDGAAADSVAPGRTASVQLVLHRPIGAWRGDRVVLRDASAARTVAGGTVLDPFAPARHRRTAQRAMELVACAEADPAARLRGLLDAAPFGVSLRRWSQAEGRRDSADAFLPAATLIAADVSHCAWALGARHASAIGDSAMSALRGFHAREPEALGPDAARLRRIAAPRLPDAVWSAVLASLRRQGRVDVRGAFVHLPVHGLSLSAADARLAQKIAPMLAAAGFEGRWARDLGRDARESEALVRVTLARLARGGALHQVVKDLYYPAETLARLAAVVRTTAGADGGAVTAARFRDATGLGRKRAIQLLEYFDRIGLLRRVGDEHRLRSDTALFTPAAS
ncbi:MAG TPA: selenocysteine-specific translation elongation factor [Caldimonas sp.]|nr:selenocysteine-specific translation elongation factor [Caldimonas sp.]HEV7577528.1 selenocysteine-specific translation elongation factor [Caldimonas sp.]